MKILFAFKGGNFLAPLGLCSLSAIARQEGHLVELVEITSPDALLEITQKNPDLVAYSSLSGEAKDYISFNQKLKEKIPSLFTILGGPHATFHPSVLKETSFDAICVGEGEGAFLDVLYYLSQGSSLSGIPNILTRECSLLTVRDLIKDLDSLPFPDYSLFYDQTPMGEYPLKGFMASRGCPYDCTYCFNAAWHKIYQGKGPAVRRHSVDYVIEDICRVQKRWPLSNVKFQDDVFSFRADDWLEEFALKYKKEVGLPFYVNTRCDLLTEDMVKLLKEAGCRTVSMSIEAGNPQTRQKILKRQMSNEMIIDAQRLCKKHGVHTYTNCMLGLPKASLKGEIESIDLCIQSQVSWAEFPIFHPYPQTELGSQAIEQGFYTPDYSKMHTSCLCSSPLNCFDESQKNIQSNLSVLGSVAVVFPWLRYPIIKWLIHLPPNRFFTLLYWMVKNYVVRKKLYVTKASWHKSLRIYFDSLKQELFRHRK